MLTVVSPRGRGQGCAVDFFPPAHAVGDEVRFEGAAEIARRSASLSTEQGGYGDQSATIIETAPPTRAGCSAGRPHGLKTGVGGSAIGEGKKIERAEPDEDDDYDFIRTRIDR